MMAKKLIYISILAAFYLKYRDNDYNFFIGVFFIFIKSVFLVFLSSFATNSIQSWSQSLYDHYSSSQSQLLYRFQDTMWEIQLLGLVVLILSPLQVESIPIDTQTEGVIPDKLITVDQTSISFKRGGLPYKFAGLNFWSAPFLDFDRLTNELDLLKQYNISNFRIMALTEGGWIDGNTLASNGPRRLDPAVSNNPCSYESIDGNIDIGLIQHAENLRKVLIELAKRDMSAVLVLNNEYYWSGGMPQYMKWAYEAYSKRQYNGYWDCYDQFDQPNLANYLFQPRWYSLDVLRQYDNYANTLYNFWLEFDDQEGCYAIPKNHTFHMPVPNTLEGDAKSQSWNDMMRLSQLFMCNRRAQYYFLRRTQKLIQLVTQSGTQEEKALVRNGIMSWQLANEPRCFYRWDYICTDWIRKTVNLIKSVDNEHLVSLGSEGLLPSSWGKYANVGYAAYHVGTGLDYLTIHAKTMSASASEIGRAHV
eukprot:TRINITY_DN27347_c0_g2_i1.p1 TRINITY_DN27347_c0_g2~~TRINITY_DN27347_c0_g2_i1.p1  ORF type:complete len:476 (+),score=32.79 TRINITY_DN27347_c0_g2_i1:2-1429(+)